MKTCIKCSCEFSSDQWECQSCGYIPDNIDGFPVLSPELGLEARGFHPDTFESLAKLEGDNFWFRARNNLILWALQKHCPNMAKYLEIGCGTGFVLSAVAKAFPDTVMVGSEVSAAGLAFAASRVQDVELLQMDARRIPYVNEFDAIGAFDVLEHIADDQSVLESMHCALHPGGTIAITVPQHQWLWSATDESACHFRRYSIAELRNKVVRAGFKVVLETSFVSLLLPAMAASRLLKTKGNSLDSAFAELSLPPLLNSSFAFVMGIERTLITSGCRFPIGGSKLLVATKSGEN